MTAAPRERPRRFYTHVQVVEADGRFAVRLDARPVKTPAGAALSAPTRALADLIAAEWDAQTDVVEIDAMHATRLANLALDRVGDHRDALADQVRAYAETDLVCHLADREPALRARQEESWAALRAWAGEALGVALTPCEGIIAAAQPAESLEAARQAALACDDFALAGLSHAVALLGSTVLGLALLHARLDADAAFAASRIDEAWQEERWGVDAEAAERAAGLQAELHAVAAYLRALG